MSAISKFCEQRGIPPSLEEAFTMYCRSMYASKFSLGNGDTIKGIVSKMTSDQVLEAWIEFVKDMKSVIESGQ